jgi:hypothetical protein
MFPVFDPAADELFFTRTFGLLNRRPRSAASVYRFIIEDCGPRLRGSTSGRLDLSRFWGTITFQGLGPT